MLTSLFYAVTTHMKQVPMLLCSNLRLLASGKNVLDDRVLSIIDDEYLKLTASCLDNYEMSPKRLVSHSTCRGKEPAHSYVAEGVSL